MPRKRRPAVSPSSWESVYPSLDLHGDTADAARRPPSSSGSSAGKRAAREAAVAAWASRCRRTVTSVAARRSPWSGHTPHQVLRC